MYEPYFDVIIYSFNWVLKFAIIQVKCVRIGIWASPGLCIGGMVIESYHGHVVTHNEIWM